MSYFILLYTTKLASDWHIFESWERYFWNSSREVSKDAPTFARLLMQRRLCIHKIPKLMYYHYRNQATFVVLKENGFTPLFVVTYWEHARHWVWNAISMTSFAIWVLKQLRRRKFWFRITSTKTQEESEEPHFIEEIIRSITYFVFLVEKWYRLFR